jgi:hypothetical protein
MNLGNERSDTTIPTTDGITVLQIKRIPSGRGMEMEIKGVWYINVYAPSGVERILERERFFNNELLLILPVSPAEMLLVGGFNSNINKLDSTGNVSWSKALDRLVSGLGLHDLREVMKTTHGYNQYAALSATCLDRIYVTEGLYTWLIQEISTVSL